MRLFGTGTSPIGLDMGSRIIKAAQLQRCRQGWRLHAATVMPRAAEQSPDQTAARVVGVLGRQGFTGRRVVLAAPVRKVECEMLDLPPRASGAPIDRLAAMELGRVAKLETGRFEAACWDVPTAARSQGTAVIALALRHEDADTLVEPLERHGLEIVAIDAQSLALHRACRPLLDSNQATAILDLGWSAASLHVANGETMLYQRTLWDAGVEYLLKAIVADHALDENAAELVLRPESQNPTNVPSLEWLPGLIRRFAEHLCEELHASLAFARQRFPGVCGQQLLLTGGGSALPELVPMLTERLKMQVSILHASQIVNLAAGAGVSTKAPLLASAVGLALYEEEP